MTRRWLVAHDFSDQATMALDRAAEHLAALGGGTLLLVHVHAPLTTGFGIDLGATAAFQDVDKALDKEAHQRLDGIAKGILDRYPTLSLSALVEVGRPADQLVEIADREAVDLIILGSHGRRGLERFFLGSVAERVLRLAARSVLIVKANPEAPRT